MSLSDNFDGNFYSSETENAPATDSFKQVKDKLLWIVTQARIQQKAGAFIKRSKDSIRLFGKQATTIMACDKNKMHEIILIEDEMSAGRHPGDSVTLADVFLSSDNAVWENDSISFMTEDGVLVSANQYEYIKKHGNLSQYQYFAKSNNKDSNVAQMWKSLCRKAGEARKDKAKEISYLTIGSVTWTKSNATPSHPAEIVTSPLLLCQITEASNYKDAMRFTITADTVKVNTILERELRQRQIELFLDVDSANIEFGKPVLDVLARIEENAKFCSDVEVNINDFNLCILDSTNETICQMIEKNIEKLAASPLIQVLMGKKKYEELDIEKVADFPIYPLPADDSQRKVIQRVLNGDSINISAAAGTGKSHLMVLLVACLIVAGQNMCVMSEKRAANEVFLKYASHIGLGDFCLEINNKMSVAQLADRIDKIRNTARLYVDPVRARELLGDAAETEELFDNFYKAVYSGITGLDMSLYELIGEALSENECDDVTDLNSDVSQYRTVRRRLDTLQNDIDNAVNDEEFSLYLSSGTTGDEEADALITESVTGLKGCGIDIVPFIVKNRIKYGEIASVAKANISRKLAKELIQANDIGKFGNAFLRSKYAKLTEINAKMQSLYAAYLRQQVSERICTAAENDKELLPLLERIKTSKMSVQDFFKKYGKNVMKLCPVIVTTPSAAVNYMTDDMNTFDTLLIDEASQVPIISVLPFLIGQRRLIAFGDNMQLDVTSFFTKSADEGYDENGEYNLSLTDKSILHLVQGKGIPSERLLYHYRSKTHHLVTVSNLLCYNGMLNVIPDVYTGWDKLPDYLGFEYIKADVDFDPARAVAAINRKGKNGRDDNRYIASYIARVKEEMARKIAERVAAIKRETPEKSVGVVTMNDEFQGAVQDEVEDLFARESIENDFDNDEALWIRSLENAQGKEADIVIIAIEYALRSVKGELHKNISGFFNAGEKSEQSGNNRLNVLFTRAREKNIIYTAFDYSEIKNTEKSLKRLYTYLEYAVTGNMSCVKAQPKVQDKLNEHAARVIEEAMPGKKVRRKIGANAMMVDLGMLGGDDAEKFEIGFLLPDANVSLNTLCTKINLLERAGWRILPLSLVYLLEKPETFKSQLPKLIANEKKLGSDVEENYLTAVRPLTLVTIEEIALRGRIKEPTFDEPVVERPFLKRLTAAEFAALGVVEICRNACDDEMRNASQEKLNESYKVNSQAFLIKMAQGAHNAALNGDEAKLERFVSKAHYLYSNLGEKRACYLFAQLLRLLSDYDSADNQSKIFGLLSEAVFMNMIKEVL